MLRQISRHLRVKDRPARENTEGETRVSQLVNTCSQRPVNRAGSRQDVLNGRRYWEVNPSVQELCESRGGRPGLSVLTSLPVSVDVKQY